MNLLTKFRNVDSTCNGNLHGTRKKNFWRLGLEHGTSDQSGGLNSGGTLYEVVIK